MHKPKLNLLLLKLSSKCNLNCSYCYIYNTGHTNSLINQPKFITKETVLNLTKQLYDICASFPNLIIGLHGGEPLLIGHERLHFILETFKKNQIKNITIQTNATLITREILDLLYEYQITIGISLDGSQDINDKYRVYRTGKGSFKKTRHGLDLILNHPICTTSRLDSIISVIDPTTDPVEVYGFLSQFNANHIDFLFKDGYYERLPEGKSTLYSVEYGKWLAELAKHYLALDNPVPIRCINNLLKAYLQSKIGKPVYSTFGMLTINPDGDITKNDLYDITPMGSRFSRPWNINKDLILDLLMTEEYLLYTNDFIPTSGKCLSCRYLYSCHGGKEIHARWNSINGLNNPSIFCSDYTYFFDNLIDYINNSIGMVC